MHEAQQEEQQKEQQEEQQRSNRGAARGATANVEEQRENQRSSKFGAAEEQQEEQRMQQRSNLLVPKIGTIFGSNFVTPRDVAHCKSIWAGILSQFRFSCSYVCSCGNSVW